MKFSCLLKMVKQIHPLLHSSIKTKLSYRDKKKNTVRENAIQDDKLQESYYNEKKIFNQILIIYIVYQYVYTHYLLLVQLFLSLSCNVSVYVLSVSVIEENWKLTK